MYLLNDVEARILGCLIEKEITTPDYYPMTLNSLTNACNQKSNREPTVSFEKTTVVRGLDSLQVKGLTEKIYKTDSRVPKYDNVFAKSLKVSLPEVAVVCELLLRGPQTPGELRSRGDRMYKFKGRQEVEDTITGLMEREEPLVVKLPRQHGRKEHRYMHLLSGEPETREQAHSLTEEKAVVQVRSENEQIAKLEGKIVELRNDLDTLKQQFAIFRSQFE
jgi:uncharacterized protein YceH (UPF0502 family)